jgi:DNA primase
VGGKDRGVNRLGTKLRDYDDHIQRPGRRKGKVREWLHRVDVVDFLEGIEVENIKQATGDEVNFSCPFPGHSSGDMGKPSAYMNDGSKDESLTTVWKCHGCGRAGNAISFLAEMENIGPSQAASELRERYAPDYRAPRGGIGQEFEERVRKHRERKQEREEVVIPNDKYDKMFGVDWADAWCEWNETKDPVLGYLFARGFEPETLMDWRIGYDERTQRFTIPVCNQDGEIVGVKARAHKKGVKPKYLILGDKDGKPKRYGWKHYEKSRVLFGMHMCSDASRIVLVEGELDVIALWQVGIPAVATGGAALSATQSLMLRDQAEDGVVVFYDSDNAGWEATVEVIAQLQPFVRVKVVPDHDGDASSMVQNGEVEELRALIASGVSSYRLLID